jgi:uncharacterized membrane protein
MFLGHYGFNPRVLEKSKMVRQFFQKETPDYQRKKIITDERISYIYYGRWERMVGDFHPASAPYLEMVFSNERVNIYRVLP